MEEGEGSFERGADRGTQQRGGLARPSAFPACISALCALLKCSAEADARRCGWQVFGGCIPTDLLVEWSNSLSKTAGVTSFKLKYTPKVGVKGQVTGGRDVNVEYTSKVMNTQSAL